MDTSYAWHAAIAGFSRPIAPVYAKPLWHSQGAMHMMIAGSHARPMSPLHRRSDSLFLRAVKTSSYERTRRAYRDMAAQWIEAVRFVPLYAPVKVLCIRNRFRNLQPSLWGGLLHNIEWVYAVSDAAADTTFDTTRVDTPAVTAAGTAAGTAATAAVPPDTRRAP
jgi:hypothetical protein